MQRYNLTFCGDIQPGCNPVKVRQRFAELLEINDREYLNQCFSGDPVVLVGGLERKEAADLYRRLDRVGVVVELIAMPATDETDEAGETADAPSEPAPAAEARVTTEPTAKKPAEKKQPVQTGKKARRQQRRTKKHSARATPQAGIEQVGADQPTTEQPISQPISQTRIERPAPKPDNPVQTIKLDLPTQPSIVTGAAYPEDQAASAKFEAMLQRPAPGKAKITEPPALDPAPVVQELKQEQQAEPVEPVQPAKDNALEAHRPNTYALNPFRSLAALRERPQRAARLRLRYILIAILCLLALIATLVARALFEPAAPVDRVELAAPLHKGGLALAVEDDLLLHDRAGVGSEIIPLQLLGLASVEQLLPAPDDKQYLVLGRSLPAADGSEGQAGLWRCDFDALTCSAFGSQMPPPDWVGLHPFLDVILSYLATGEGAGGELRKMNAEGELQAVAARKLLPQPTLHMQDGLLYTNSLDAPALSVLRYDDEALGEQLDEILLLDPQAIAAERNQVVQFTHVGQSWWVILANAESGDRGLYRFDDKWLPLGELTLPEGFSVERLIPWGEKLLVLDSNRLALQRFSATAQPEAPLLSDLITSMVESQQRKLWWHEFLWQSLAVIFAGIGIACAVLAYLHHLRQLAFRSTRLRGADPIESLDIRWLDRPVGREQRLQRYLQYYLAGAAVVLVVAIISRVEPATLIAWLLVLGGPALAAALYLRTPQGHIGVHGNSLLLVDHHHTYHMGSGARVRYRDWFVMIDDVLVFAGPGWAPAFSTEQLRQDIAPLAQRGVRVDRRSILVRLVEGRHPLAMGAGIVVLTTTIAIAVVLLNAI